MQSILRRHTRPNNGLCLTGLSLSLSPSVNVFARRAHTRHPRFSQPLTPLLSPLFISLLPPLLSILHFPAPPPPCHNLSMVGLLRYLPISSVPHSISFAYSGTNFILPRLAAAESLPFVVLLL